MRNDRKLEIDFWKWRMSYREREGALGMFLKVNIILYYK